MTDQEVVLYDSESIYIGNIFTIDSDMNLPQKGQLGSDISWESNFIHIIDNKGKVTRPRCGTGNRDVSLTATIKYGNSSITREFLITVLEVESKDKIKSILPFNCEISLGEPYELPGIVIIEMEKGFYSTKVVKWKDAPDFSKLAAGEYTILGESLKENESLIPKAIIQIVENKDKEEIYPFKKSLNQFDLSDVTISNGNIFYENRNRIEEYLLNVDDDRILYNFREAASLDTKGALPMSGWDAPECLLKGHTSGHYLSAVALCYEGSINYKDELKKKIDYLIEELALCQDTMEKSGKFNYGFLSGYNEDQFDKLEQYEVYPKIWAPYYTLHKIMAGLLDCYEFGKNDNALKVCSKLGTWVYNRLSKLSTDQLNKMWAMYIAGEFGGMNEVMARLYKITKKDEYIKASKYFNNEKLFLPMINNIDTLANIHANQHVPQIIGAMEIYEQTKEKDYFLIAKNFWDFVINHHCYNIGGAGEGEMFKAPDQIASFLTDKTAESCVSYNMLKLTKMLFQYIPSSKYMDYYERTLYNHIVSTHDKSGPTGGSTYFMPLVQGATREFDLKENSCCHGTGLENHVKYQDSIFFKDGPRLYVNLYIPSTVKLKDEGMTCTISEDFINTKKSTILIHGNGYLELMLRIPSWLLKSPEIKLNGKSINYDIKDGYAVVKGEFKTLDKVEILLPFSLKIEKTKDDPKVFSILYGPLVMVVVNEDTNFINISENEVNEFKILENNRLKIGSYDFIPFYDAFNVPYHSYFKIIY